MYGGLGVTFFLLVLFLREVAGYSALRAGLAMMPVTLVTFALSKRMGRLTDRYGPQLFMGLGPLAAAGLALLLRLGASPDYLTELLPALLLFSVGLSSTVAPLMANRPVRRRRDRCRGRLRRQQRHATHRQPARHRRHRRGHAAQFSLELDRSLGALPLSPGARAAVAQARGQTLASVAPSKARIRVARAIQVASVDAFHVGIGICAVLVAVGGVLALAAIRNPRRAHQIRGLRRRTVRRPAPVRSAGA